MAKKSKLAAKPESVAAAKKRHLHQLALAVASTAGEEELWPNYLDKATARYGDLHTVVRAVIPGTQTDKNTRVALDAAVKALAGKIRRKGAK